MSEISTIELLFLECAVLTASRLIDFLITGLLFIICYTGDFEISTAAFLGLDNLINTSVFIILFFGSFLFFKLKLYGSYSKSTSSFLAILENEVEI